MTDDGAASERAQLLGTQVFMRGANRPFGELTGEDVRMRAQELREAVGWGPTARVAPVALAWRELSVAMERVGAATVADLLEDVLGPLGRRLWVVLPSPAPRRREPAQPAPDAPGQQPKDAPGE
jgi:hypothetical protein